MPDWGAWNNEPLLADLLILAGWAYSIVVGPLRDLVGLDGPATPAPSRGQLLRFYGGLLLLYLVGGPPWERVERDYVFSAAMAAHLLILYAAVPLTITGLPPWLADRWRLKIPPLVGGLLFVLLITGSYVTRVYEWSVASGWRMSLQHLTFFAAGFAFWMPLLSPSRAAPPLRYGAQLAYLFALEVALTGVFSYLLMTDHAIYPTYEFAPRLIPGLSAEDDQLLGGILLSAVSSLVMVGAFARAFFAWAKDSARSG